MGNVILQIWRMEELRKRILFTLGMLGIYRLGIFIPSPGIDRALLGEWFNDRDNSLFGLYDMFSGGALAQYSVFFLGIMPYITASIIIQLMSELVPTLKRIKDEGQAGRQKLTQYTRYFAIVIALAQAFSTSVSFESMRVGSNNVVIDPGWPYRLLTMVTMTGGACFVMWLGEQMTERGVGNGASVLIAAGIIEGLPQAVAVMAQFVQMGEVNLLQASLLLCFVFLVIYLIVFIERGQLRIPLQYAKRVLGRRVYEGQTTYLPLKVNNAGVIPPIFASSLLMLPSTAGQFIDWVFLDWISAAFYPGRWLYNLSYVVLVVVFAFYYTAVTFKPEDIAENLKKQGGFIPKVRPGKETAQYLDWVLNRLTTAGGLYLAAICVLPTLLIVDYGVPFYFGGTSLLIVVGVALDSVAQIEAQLSTRLYDGVAGPKGMNIKRRQRLGGQGPWV
jgi:preprotein translocase subunit SecY